MTSNVSPAPDDDEITRAELVAKAAKERLRDSHYWCEVCGMEHEEPCAEEEES